MGDFGVDTAVWGGDGRYESTLSRDWEIWGPNGGYLAAVALRAAGAEAGFGRPANVSVHFLGSPRFEPVELEVATLKAGRRAQSLRVLMRQAGKPVLHLTCWAVADGMDGVAHAHDEVLDVPHWSELPTIPERLAAAGIEPDGQRFRFWGNFDERPIDWWDRWEDREAGAPRWRTWLRFTPTPDLTDPWIDAGRILLLADVGSWPAATRAHTQLAYTAPSLDVACHFNRLAPTAEWLLVEHVAPVATDGLIGSVARVWDDAGHLLCSGVTQLLSTPAPG